jgi:Tol biopolymer transport system component
MTRRALLPLAALLFGLLLATACDSQATSPAALTPVPEVSPLPPELLAVAEKGQRVFGPADGSLFHKGKMYMDIKTASSAEPQSLVVEARFYHPQACSSFPWDICFVFRRDDVRSYAVWVDCKAGWSLSLSDQELGLWIPIARGPLQGLNVAGGGSNHLKVIAAGGDGYLLVNERPAARLDLSDFVGPGEVDIAVNFSHSNQQPGKSTRYEGFTVQSLDEAAWTAAKPENRRDLPIAVALGAPPPGNILFTRKVPDKRAVFGGNQALFTVRPDGSELRQLSDLVQTPGSAAWSPDGKMIVWDGHNITGDGAIFVMNADGTEVRRLTQSKGYKYSPRWSPDGRKIAFHATPANSMDHNSDIWVVDADGASEVRLTTDSAEDKFPDWSPDSTRIAFFSGREGNSDIYVMDADGRNQRRLTNDQASDVTPAWSPDGTRIAFSSDRSGRFLIYTMKTDGTEVTRLTEAGRSEMYPTWSPDGKMIAFSGLVSGGSPSELGYNIFVASTDGRNMGRTTSGRVADLKPSWGK